jgi:hypothetical protein
LVIYVIYKVSPKQTSPSLDFSFSFFHPLNAISGIVLEKNGTGYFSVIMVEDLIDELYDKNRFFLFKKTRFF